MGKVQHASEAPNAVTRPGASWSRRPEQDEPCTKMAIIDEGEMARGRADPHLLIAKLERVAEVQACSPLLSEVFMLLLVEGIGAVACSLRRLDSPQRRVSDCRFKAYGRR
jgi:hypothetical protein